MEENLTNVQAQGKKFSYCWCVKKILSNYVFITYQFLKIDIFYLRSEKVVVDRSEVGSLSPNVLPLAGRRQEIVGMDYRTLESPFRFT